LRVPITPAQQFQPNPVVMSHSWPFVHSRWLDTPEEGQYALEITRAMVVVFELAVVVVFVVFAVVVVVVALVVVIGVDVVVDFLVVVVVEAFVVVVVAFVVLDVALVVVVVGAIDEVAPNKPPPL